MRVMRDRPAKVAPLSVRLVRASVWVALLGAMASCGAPPSPSVESRAGPCAGQPPGCGSPLGTAQALAAGRWSALPNAPLTARSDQSALWTGAELLIWGGATSSGTGSQSHQISQADGAGFEPATGAWHRLPPAPLAPRQGAAAAWTGTEAIVWGGDNAGAQGGVSETFADGASYDPSTGQWRGLPGAPLSPRTGATAIWTGREVIFLGGRSANGRTLLDGATYDPADRSWARLPPFPALRRGSPVGTTVVWTGKQLLVWATNQVFSYPAPNTVGISGAQHGATWEPGWSSWRPMAPPPAGVATFGATALWTGTTVLLLNGTNCLPAMSCPALDLPSERTFDPSTGSWGKAPSNLVAGAAGPIVWTGNAVVALNGGAEAGGPAGTTLSPGDGVVYDPRAGVWRNLPRSPLGALYGASIFWTGRQILLWGAVAGAGPSLGEALTPGAPEQGRSALRVRG